MSPGAGAPLDRVTSIKVKLGLVVAVSVAVAAVLGTVSDSSGVPPWLAIPVTVLLALGVTQLLATGMTSPLREMTGATRRMARGDYAARVRATSSDEVGELGRAFNTMAADLAAVDQQRRDLVATVSHELRTPLTGLVGLLENLEDGVVPADPAGLRTALTQAERLAALVTDLLDLSRLDAGAAQLAEDRVDVAALVTSAVAEARTLGREVSYDVRVVPDGLAVVGDRARLHQLLANLLDNASRHSTTGGVVHVSAHPHGADRWWLEVANTGPAIEPPDRDRIFERYGRLADGGGGTGLGLAIARWVTELHGGTIAAVEPVPGEDGARLRVDLPTSTPAPAPPPPAREVPPMTAMTAPSLPSPAPSSTPSSTPAFFGDLTGGAWPGREPAPRPRLVLAAAAVGVLAGLVLADHLPGLGYVLVLLAGGAVVVAASPLTDRFTQACAVLAVPLAAMLMVRDATWIAALCALAATVLCVAGSARARSVAGLLVAGVLWPLSAVHGLPWLRASFRALGGRGHGAPVLRTVAWCVAGVVGFGLLFASADALFASWVDIVIPDIDGLDLVFRIFVAVAVAGLVLATAYFAHNPPRVEPEVPRAPRPVQRRYEWLAPVLLVNGVFVLFLVAQAAAAFGGHDYVRRTTGLTYAAYVHQGFGQLTVVSVLTLLVIWAASRRAPLATAADRAWLRGSLGLLCVLALVVVGSALHRMDLYQQAYGFTRLRLLVDAFELWLGVLLVAVLVAGVRLVAGWLPRAALLTGSLVLLGLGVSNPDAWIVRHNVDRFAATGKVDLTYLAGLSADATPTLLQRLPAGDAGCVARYRARLGGDLLDWNLGRVRAEHALATSGPRACDDVRGR